MSRVRKRQRDRPRGLLMSAGKVRLERGCSRSTAWAPLTSSSTSWASRIDLIAIAWTFPRRW